MYSLATTPAVARATVEAGLRHSGVFISRSERQKEALGGRGLADRQYLWSAAKDSKPRRLA